MNNWIESINELMNAGTSELSFSFLDARMSLPDIRICAISVFSIVFFMFCLWEEKLREDTRDNEYDSESR